MRTAIRRPMSLTARLVLLFALGSSTVLLVLGWVIGAEIERHFERMDTEILRIKLEQARDLMQQAKRDNAAESAPLRLQQMLNAYHGLEYQLTGSDGQLLLSSRGIPFFPVPRLGNPPVPEHAHPFVWTWNGEPMRGLVAALPAANPQMPPSVLGVSIGIDEHRMFMEAFDKTLWLFIAGAALVSGFAGWVAARRGLAPLRKMQEHAASITASKLDRRLDAETVPAELAALALTLNATFERLEESFRRLSNFSSDIAHELRTPLSNLMTQTQVCLARQRNAEGYRAVLESNVEEIDQLSRMISQMLFLAKAENGLLVPNRERLALSGLVEDLFEFYDALAEERGVRLQLQGSGMIDGDKMMLSRAISNLLSNAIRYARPGTAVTAKITHDVGVVRMSVENEGETIAADALPKIFDRFYRADCARQHGQSEGAGLGLAITKALVLAHGGNVAASSAHGRTCITLSLPQTGEKWMSA